jgi:endogenous inhibitor of DNA gyrase (YacG/DUF329 family)
MNRRKEEMPILCLMCAHCGRECDDEAYSWDEHWPFCSESCFEAWRDAEVEP